MPFVYYPGFKIESSNCLVDMMLSIVEFKMSVLEESVRVLSPNRRIFITTASPNSKNATFNTFDFVQKGHSFVCIGRTVNQKVGRCFNFITAKAKRIEAVLKAMLKLVFAKVTQTQM